MSLRSFFRFTRALFGEATVTKVVVQENAAAALCSVVILYTELCNVENRAVAPMLAMTPQSLREPV